MNYMLNARPLIVCEDSGSYGSQKKITFIKEFSSKVADLYKFTVQGRDWKTISATERYAEVMVPEISDPIVKQGLVMLYLYEAGRTVSLPFTYYQAKRAMSFQPAYESGRVYITLLGNFIPNPHTSYTFRMLIVNGKGLKQHKKTSWYNFDQAMKAAGLY